MVLDLVFTPLDEMEIEQSISLALRVGNKNGGMSSLFIVTKLGVCHHYL